VDAVVIGLGTALADDPLLTVRLEAGAADYGRRPARIVLDEELKLPQASRLVVTAGEAPLIVATCPGADRGGAAELTRRGATVIEVPREERAADGSPGAAGAVALAPLLDELGRRGMTNVLVEGGRQVLESFLREGLVDRLAVFVAPKLVGGDPGRAAPGPLAAPVMAEAVKLLRPTVTRIGGDVLIEGVLCDY
jgi:diaminohydroxyphosphoribosylaminopyrimidine deaminase/5-amino-6-(5-phosphoribosylamino)uracil reductase